MISIHKPIEIVTKGWGEEVIIANNAEYCGKILKFKKGYKFSNHFHLEKRESFYILTGKLKISYYNLRNAERFAQELQVGDVVDIPRGEPHQIEALEDSEVIEFSTHHEDGDSYRIEKGASQI